MVCVPVIKFINARHVIILNGKRALEGVNEFEIFIVGRNFIHQKFCEIF